MSFVAADETRRNPHRVVVTGGGGFVGRHLMRALQMLGYEAVSFDLADGLDVCEGAAVARAVRGASTVVHLAA